MTLFRKAENTTAYLKMGIMGFAGSGKTYTASDIAAGLVMHLRKHNLPGADKPIFFLDTETGSDWIKPKIEGAGIELHTAKTKAFTDLTTAMREAPGNASVLIIDSITHFWVEFTEAYQKVKKRTRGLEFQDWAYLKKHWRANFTEPFVNSPLHIIICGRAGYEYDHYTDEAGKRQIEKSGVKMKAEGELGFEPSILLMMEREQDLDTMRIKHVATVMKDRRSDAKTLDGKRIEAPTFNHFLPHIEYLNLGGTQLGVDASRNSENAIEPDTYDRKRTDREIVLEMIQNLGTKHFTASHEDKKRKLELLEAAFGTTAWTAIEKRISIDELREGYDRMHMQLEGRPGPYNTMGADESVAEKPRVRLTIAGLAGEA
jgi:hypothetical protein